MLEKIKPYFNSKNFCIENLYTSICLAFERDFRKMYAYSWNFGYFDEGGKLSGKIRCSRDGKIVNYEQNFALEEYCGIKPIWHMNCNMKRFPDIVKKELYEGRPVGLGIDIYSCYWHIFYKKYHFMHYCLIVGMDERGFICVDDTLANVDGDCILSDRTDHVIISYETFEKYYYGFVTYKITSASPSIVMDDAIYLSALKALTGHNGKSDFDSIRSLSNEFLGNFDLKEEIGEEKEPKAMAIVRSFSTVSWSRYNYCQFLSSGLNQCKININNVMEGLEKSSNLWGSISNYIIMCSLNNQNVFNTDAVRKNITQIIDIEERIAHMIVDEYEEIHY